TGDEVRPTPEYTEGESERLPEPESDIEEAVDKALEASEKAADTPVVKAWDDTVKAVQAAVETLEPEHDEGITDFRRPMLEGAAAAQAHQMHAGAAHDHNDLHAAFLSDTTTVLGRTVTVPGGIYTVVFGFLAVATLVEVLIGSLPSGILLIPLLLAIAVVKAGLVVAYYMHLRVDPRLFLYVLIVPLAMALLATLYLIAVPPTGY
ncbi:MAG TPA: cytochrome C oxidase subunit IV family protein, partial [Spirillospora sp.]|nr:cytochrome C oxidase subunit IV family protein [Spirillospora sp.]